MSAAPAPLPPCGVAPPKAKIDPRAARRAQRPATPATLRGLWFALLAALALTVVAQVWAHAHAPLAVAHAPGFFALFGLAGAALLVAAAKILGIFLKREETYYGD